VSGIFDRLNAELDQLGDKVRTAFESSKLHLERSRLIGLRSKAAYKLGMQLYKKERGGEVNQAEIDALFAQLDDITAKIAKLDREIDAVHEENISVDEQPAPAAEPADAEVSGDPGVRSQGEAGN
jgi:outer membrane murein-binding lipoprotein Lpp